MLSELFFQQVWKLDMLVHSLQLSPVHFCFSHTWWDQINLWHYLWYEEQCKSLGFLGEKMGSPSNLQHDHKTFHVSLVWLTSMILNYTAHICVCVCVCVCLEIWLGNYNWDWLGLQYHEVIGGLVGKWGRYITKTFIVVSLTFGCTLQLIACSRYMPPNFQSFLSHLSIFDKPGFHISKID